MVGKGKGEEVAVRAGRVFTDAAPLLLGSADHGGHGGRGPWRAGGAGEGRSKRSGRACTGAL